MNDADETAKMFTDERKEPVEKEGKIEEEKKKKRKKKAQWPDNIRGWQQCKRTGKEAALFNCQVMKSPFSLERWGACSESRQRQMLCAEPGQQQIKDDGVKSE